MGNFVKNNKVTVQAFIGVVAIAGLLFVYLMWYVSPDEVTEKVKVIAVTADGCIAESFDGYSIDIGHCDVGPGEIIVATYDAKEKERRLMMNPTR